jgi:hypothetical protein
MHAAVSPDSAVPAFGLRTLNQKAFVDLPVHKPEPADWDHGTGVPLTFSSTVSPRFGVGGTQTTPRNSTSSNSQVTPSSRTLGLFRSNTSPGSPVSLHLSAPSAGNAANARHDGGATTHRPVPATDVGATALGAVSGNDDAKTSALSTSPVRISTRVPKAGIHATKTTDGKKVTRGQSHDNQKTSSSAINKDSKGATTWLPANTVRADGNAGSPRNADRGPRGLAQARNQIEKPQKLATLTNPTGSSVVVMVKGSWFNAILSYNAEKVLITSTTRMPAFVSSMPAVLTGDGASWIEVMMCVERSCELAKNSVDFPMPSTAGKPIFRGSPQIFWNGKQESLYGPLSAFMKAKLSETQLAKFISSACEKIALEYPGQAYKRLEKTVSDEANKSAVAVPDMDLLGKYILAISKAALKTLDHIPPEIVQVLAVLDHQIIKWALESGYAINEINAQRHNAVVQFFITRGISALFTVPDGSIGAASVLRKYADKELRRLAPKVTAPILKASSNLLPAAIKRGLADMLRLRRTELLEQATTANATKKAKGQKALAEKRGPLRAATDRGSHSSAPLLTARKLAQAKRKLLNAVRADAAFETLSAAAKELLDAEFEELKQKGLNAGKIEMATRKLVERIRPDSPTELAELEQYLAILKKRILVEALVGEVTYTTLPLALQKSIKSHLNALPPAGMTPDGVAAAAKMVIDGAITTEEEAPSIDLFRPVLETGRWRPDYAVKEVESLFADTWNLDDGSLDAGPAYDDADGNGAPVLGMESGAQPQPSQARFGHDVNGEAKQAQAYTELGWPDNPFPLELSDGETSPEDHVHSVTTPLVQRELEKADRKQS